MADAMLQLLTFDLLDHGDLFAAGYKRTVIVAGKRRRTLRVQSVIVSRLWKLEVDARDAWMVPHVDEAIAAWRSRG